MKNMVDENIETRLEFKIPKSFGEPVFVIVTTIFVILTAAVAVDNLINRAAIIASSIWLLLIGFILWACYKEAGIRKALIYFFGYLVGREIIWSAPKVTSPTEICLGYLIFGRRFIIKKLAIERIESIEWNTGQATSMAGRDMNDWSVCLWFDHNDPERSEKQKMLRKPDQEVIIVGPSKKKESTEAFGLLFVDFLCKAGAKLVQGEKSCCFVRRSIEKEQEK